MLDKSSIHRLIGAGIMLVAAISVLPIILDGEKPEELGTSVVAPSKAPEITVVKIKPVQPLSTSESENTDHQETAEQAKVVSVKKVEIPEPESSAAKETSQPDKVAVEPVKTSEPDIVEKKPDRWVVQIASFKNQSNAQDLVKKLQAANYAAYSITTKTLHKVFVGPEIKKSRCESIKEEIKKEFKLEGFVVKYSGS